MTLGRKEAVQRLNEAIAEIEALMVLRKREPLIARRALDRMMTDVRGIVRRMLRMNVANHRDDVRFWRMSKRAVKICVAAVRILSRA